MYDGSRHPDDVVVVADPSGESGGVGGDCCCVENNLVPVRETRVVLLIVNPTIWWHFRPRVQRDISLKARDDYFVWATETQIGAIRQIDAAVRDSLNYLDI
jgi:hypothetical protein